MIVGCETDDGGFVAETASLGNEVPRAGDDVWVWWDGEEDFDFMVKIFGVAGHGFEDCRFWTVRCVDPDEADAVVELVDEIQLGDVHYLGVNGRWDFGA